MKSIKFWKPNSFEISSFEFRLKDRVNGTYLTSGSDNTKLCEYKYNELGFRGDSVRKSGFKVMSFGCSFTEGVGVNNHQTWPAQFTSMIPNGVNMNFGTGGRSADFIARCLLTYFDIIKPDLVLIMYPFLFRREIYTKDNGIEPFIPGISWSYLKKTEEGKKIQKNLEELQNENEDFINWYKNHLLMTYFLKDKKCNWLWNGSFDVPKDYNEPNRFDGDYNKFLDFGVDGSHPGPTHNEIYAKKLYEHININFPDFLFNNDEKEIRII